MNTILKTLGVFVVVLVGLLIVVVLKLMGWWPA